VTAVATIVHGPASEQPTLWPVPTSIVLPLPLSTGLPSGPIVGGPGGGGGTGGSVGGVGGVGPAPPGYAIRAPAATPTR
jgi:hypothetical protein